MNTPAKTLLYCMICKQDFIGERDDPCPRCGLTIPVICLYQGEKK